ncbi:MFS transporter [Komagataeibacter rhaeticus]|nr:MFS transporter [Komagataeibacter rhaeticus]
MILGYQLMISCGLLAAFVSDGLFSYFGVWRWMLGIVGFPGLVFMMGVLFLPPARAGCWRRGVSVMRGAC